MHYIIHSCNKRRWYVDKYLVPSLIKQGIEKEKIIIWNDDNQVGLLQSWLGCCKYVKENLPQNRGSWHLQDDVIIARHFASETKYIVNNGVICGFVSEKYNKITKDKVGRVDIFSMWNSFPCIFIPNRYLGEMVDWVELVKNEDQFKHKYEVNLHDDYFFHYFMRTNYPFVNSFNLKPNLVDHIDYLIGASGVKERTEQVRGYYFVDKDLVEELEKTLKREEVD